MLLGLLSLPLNSLELNFSLIMWKVDCFKLLMQSGTFREMITHPFAQKVWDKS